jgi:basic membrane protein A
LRTVSGWVILAIGFSGLTACMQSSDCFKKEVFCAALVTDTLGINDHGINQDTWAGLEELKARHVLDRAEYIESVDPRDYEKNIAYFTGKGFDVIITAGIGMRDETLRAADLQLNPPQGAAPVFVGINQPHDETRPNLIPITFAEDQMGFAAGALAARLSVTRIIGAVCETSGISSMWKYCEGFRAGAKYADKNINVQVIYRENGNSDKLFIDEEWGYNTAIKLIDRGADVIFAAGGLTGQGALHAASDKKVNAIGAERNQRAAMGISGSSVITSIYGNPVFEIESLMQSLIDGKLSAPPMGPIKYVALDKKYPESISQEMDALLLNLQTGNVKTNVNIEKP